MKLSLRWVAGRRFVPIYLIRSFSVSFPFDKNNQRTTQNPHQAGWFDWREWKRQPWVVSWSGAESGRGFQRGEHAMGIISCLSSKNGGQIRLAVTRPTAPYRASTQLFCGQIRLAVSRPTAPYRASTQLITSLTYCAASTHFSMSSYPTASLEIHPHILRCQDLINIDLRCQDLSSVDLRG